MSHHAIAAYAGEQWLAHRDERCRKQTRWQGQVCYQASCKQGNTIGEEGRQEGTNFSTKGCPQDRQAGVAAAILEKRA